MFLAKLQRNGKAKFFLPKKGILVVFLTLRLLRTRISPRGPGWDQHRDLLGFFCANIMSYFQPTRNHFIHINYKVEIPFLADANIAGNTTIGSMPVTLCDVALMFPSYPFQVLIKKLAKLCSPPPTGAQNSVSWPALSSRRRS